MDNQGFDEEVESDSNGNQQIWLWHKGQTPKDKHLQHCWIFKVWWNNMAIKLHMQKCVFC